VIRTATSSVPVARTVKAQRAEGGDGSAASAANIDDLADQVLRRIRDQLRLDRERRGAISDVRG
jgi:hypothetical protein